MTAMRADVFALKNSGLDAFLYSDVGAETNGSTLTILSILARLGKDPWVEATRWAALPKAAVIDSLAESIAAMPLAPSALAGARDSAARLVLLLPTNTQSLRQGSAAKSATEAPKLVPVTILYFAFAAWMALNIFLIPTLSTNAPAPINQSTAMLKAPQPATASLPTGAAVAGSPVVPVRQ